MTAQIPEILRYRGQNLNLCADILWSYLIRLPKSRRPVFAPSTTACHRGYVGTWEIRENQLYLVALEGELEGAHGLVEATLATALPWLKGPLKATWFSDRARCPEGRLLSYVHAGFASDYERDRYLEFDHGHLVREWLVLNPPPPVIYRLDADGRRTCVAGMSRWPHNELPDPLGDAGFDQAHRLWGKEPAADTEDDDSGYVIGGATFYP